MADLSITAAEVLASATGRKNSGTCGATLVAGDVVYKDASDSNSLKLADANSATAAQASVVGVMLNGGGDGQPANFASEDDELTIGTTAAPVAGTVYELSSTPGKMCPGTDHTGTAATARISLLGVGLGSGKIKLQIVNSGASRTT